MKFYDSVGPNPRIVRMFMAEKGIEIPKQAVDLRKGENRGRSRREPSWQAGAGGDWAKIPPQDASTKTLDAASDLSDQS